MKLVSIEQNDARLRLPCKKKGSAFSRGLSGRPLDSFALRMSKVLGRLLIDYYANCRGLSGRPLHPFGAPSDEDGFCRKKRVRKALDFLHLIYCAYSRGLCGRSATSIVAAYSRSFRLRRFASPLEKQSRLWRPVNSNQRFEYDRLVRGHNSRHWRESAHLPLDSFALRAWGDLCEKKISSFPCLWDANFHHPNVQLVFGWVREGLLPQKPPPAKSCRRPPSVFSPSFR